MVSQIVFPYKKFYPKQKELIEFIEACVAENLNCVVESPTGSGKTIAVLTAVLKKARKEGKKIIYVARTHEQCDRVIEELKAVYKKLDEESDMQKSEDEKSREENFAKGISLKAKKELCLHEIIREKIVDLEEAYFACSVLKREGKCSYYKNFLEKDFELSEPLFSNEIKEQCRILEACPYEVSRELAKQSNVIACSYLYIFVPEIRKNFLSSIEAELGDSIVIVDEAHNLAKLGVEIKSAVLRKTSVDRAREEAIENGLSEISDFLKELSDFMEKNRAEEKECESSLIFEIVRDIGMVDDMLLYGEDIRERKLMLGKRPRSFIYSVANFLAYWLSIASSESNAYAFFISEEESKRTGKKIPRFEILCLDPRKACEEIFDNAYLTIAMSGTLTPVKDFCEIVGIKNYKSISLPSPFPEDNIIALADPSITTLGSMRSSEMYNRIADKISALSRVIPGNFLVFFPSYVVLESVLEKGINVDKELFTEKQDMSSSENNAMIKKFKKSRNAILLGVQQGRNSEGQDFPGEEANAVILVGIPYAIKSPKIEAQIRYYNRVYNNKKWLRYSIGEYYGYFLPAYRALNQAAGRAHRKLSDKAAIVFLERRVAFDKKVLVNISPWIREKLKITANPERELARFFARHENALKSGE